LPDGDVGIVESPHIRVFRNTVASWVLSPSSAKKNATGGDGQGVIQESGDEDRRQHRPRRETRGEGHGQKLGLVTHLGQRDEQERWKERDHGRGSLRARRLRGTAWYPIAPDGFHSEEERRSVGVFLPRNLSNP